MIEFEKQSVDEFEIEETVFQYKMVAKHCLSLLTNSVKSYHKLLHLKTSLSCSKLGKIKTQPIPMVNKMNGKNGCFHRFIFENWVV